MIYIYKLVEKDGDISPEQMDTWDNGKFGKIKIEMDRVEVIKMYNRGYYFTTESKVAMDKGSKNIKKIISKIELNLKELQL